MADCEIIIPSHGRAGSVLTLRALPMGLPLVCVAESQEDEYVNRNPGATIVTHPDTVVGLAPKRQWIYEKFGDVFMLDDDVTGMMDLQDAVNVEPEVTADLIYQAADVARQMGIFLFTFHSSANVMDYRPQRPYRLTGFAPGHSLGLLAGSKLFFTDESVAVEDYWISALNAHYHRMCLINTRYGFKQKDTFHLAGGQSNFRTEETEMEDTLMLRRFFGTDVIRFKKGTHRAQTRHAYQRTLHLPF